ncbi:MAG: hypothetical protein Q7K55_05105 [Candidatus Levybacteria bacterium]|nr:hypothetical protein [Candidatus Levybacteria bacterium]
MEIKITSQEKLISGNTPSGVENWHSIPGIRHEDVKEINIERQKTGFILKAGLLASAFGVKKIGISLEEIDEKTGKTKNDPKVFLWNDEENKPGKEITQEFYEMFKKDGLDAHLRPVLAKKEGNISDSEVSRV